MAVGLQFSTSVATGPTNATGDPNARTFAAGITERGPLLATLVRSYAAFVTLFGVAQSWARAAHDFAQVYFLEGGSELYFTRVVGPAAVLGTLTVNDGAGTPVPTLRFDAQNPGSWAGEISIQITAGAVAGKTILVRSNGVIVETFANLTTIAEVIAALATSAYVDVTDLASATAAPNNMPAVHADAPLASGADDRASVTASTVTAAYSRFGSDLGPGAVAAPGFTADLVDDALLAHAVATDRVALLSGAVTATFNDLKALVAATQASSPLVGDYGGLFAPWVLVPDGSAVRAIDPVGYVAGVRARAINANGFQKSPAGTISNARYVVGIATPLDGSTNNSYNDAQINGITVYRGNTRLYGWRSLSKDAVNFSDLTGRSILNAVSDLVEQAADPYVFDTIDGNQILQGQIESAIVGYLDASAQNNAFYPLTQDGVQVDPGYSVEVNFTDDVIAQYGANTLVVTVGVRPSPTADLIKVNIVLAGFGVAV